MSKATQWSTTYSSQFRDRRRFEAPNEAPSDDTWNVRTQAYYGRQADLSEHAARTAEIEARTQYGAIPANEQATGGRLYPPTSTQGLGASGLNLSNTGRQIANMSGSLGSTGGSTPSPRGTTPLRYTHQPSGHDLWDDGRILPHTGVVRDAPIGYGASTFGTGHATARPQFTNGYNNGYSDGLAFTEQYTSPPPALMTGPPQQRPEQHVPGYAGFIRGSQFLHGDTFSKTSRQCLSVPTEVPLEP